VQLVDCLLLCGPFNLAVYDSTRDFSMCRAYTSDVSSVLVNITGLHYRMATSG